VQLCALKYSPHNPQNKQSEVAGLTYYATMSLFSEANRFAMNNSVMPGYDSSWYFHFGSSVGLGKCDGSEGNPKQNCLTALQDDIIDMVKIAHAQPSSLKLNGKVALMLWYDGSVSVTEWGVIVTNARNSLNEDFYVIGCASYDGAYFEVFDALAPWTGLGQWGTTSGSTVYEHAYNWANEKHINLIDSVGKYPGRVVFGGANPGFDDYTRDWGKCNNRELPRSLDLVQATFDYLTAKGIKGVVLETWDDWTEGHEWEPDVVEGPAYLVKARQGLGKVAGDAPDPAGDQRLAARWNTYGQARNCKGGQHGVPPVINLKC